MTMQEKWEERIPLIKEALGKECPRKNHAGECSICLEFTKPDFKKCWSKFRDLKKKGIIQKSSEEKQEKEVKPVDKPVETIPTDDSKVNGLEKKIADLELMIKKSSGDFEDLKKQKENLEKQLEEKNKEQQASIIIKSVDGKKSTVFGCVIKTVKEEVNDGK